MLLYYFEDARIRVATEFQLTRAPSAAMSQAKAGFNGGKPL